MPIDPFWQYEDREEWERRHEAEEEARQIGESRRQALRAARMPAMPQPQAAMPASPASLPMLLSQAPAPQPAPIQPDPLTALSAQMPGWFDVMGGRQQMAQMFPENPPGMDTPYARGLNYPGEYERPIPTWAQGLLGAAYQTLDCPRQNIVKPTLGGMNAISDIMTGKMTPQ